MLIYNQEQESWGQERGGGEDISGEKDREMDKIMV